jgi:hypothetical protein
MQIAARSAAGVLVKLPANFPIAVLTADVIAILMCNSVPAGSRRTLMPAECRRSSKKWRTGRPRYTKSHTLLGQRQLLGLVQLRPELVQR